MRSEHMPSLSAPSPPPPQTTESVRNVRDVVVLLKQLCQDVPNIFCEGGSCMEALVVLKLASLFAHPKLEPLHEDLAHVTANVLELFCHRDYQGFSAFFQDALLLLQGVPDRQRSYIAS
jgi:hypothetical protein